MSSSSSSSRNNRQHNFNRQDFDDKDPSNNQLNDSNDNIVHIKFLLPGTTTGSVIGKGGERIASLQKETSTKMKMSKAGDYFPGTQERVCLVVGIVSNVLSVYEFLSDKIKESFPGDLIRSRQIKLIIPNATAGVIIGKGGSTIETIKHDTNALLTITPKSDMQERVMTITGEDEIRLKALEIVLEKILEDPHHDSVPSVNYSNDKTASMNSLSIMNDIQPFHDHGKMNGLISMNSSSNMSIQLSGLQRLSQLIINAGGTNHITVDSLVRSLQSLGFVDPQIREIVPSITTLINYGLITIDNVTRPNIYSSTGSNNHPLFSTNQNNYSLSHRDHQDSYSRNSTDMDYKRFKSDQQRSTKTKR
ncbi:unnamed protein product [Rotaria magnacalcarata]|uniref:K Homology domain-containing protein n=1 Tax=Rotaria magnacalcarata TaxID=392030 RepID=A0A817B2H3_9BILA|nr:unnamed protein product [Rotaria magnacalcarata]CAF1607879.1 unnamed protein product [Rotaria magnacalcarata]CAF2137357.1 unnamed protein product [Rotaria magnacalcarata]CAF2151635.1 unnamed protein product [Rotaria magnacalcarata]CAF2274233.1 unnamed protein product [Rotaria magnacalcarata]